MFGLALEAHPPITFYLGHFPGNKFLEVTTDRVSRYISIAQNKYGISNLFH
jgi:hypothetical protein